MSTRKKTNFIAKQHGFFTVAVGISLLAVYGAVGTGVLAMHDTDSNDNEMLASQEQVTMSANTEPAHETNWME